LQFVLQGEPLPLEVVALARQKPSYPMPLRPLICSLHPEAFVDQECDSQEKRELRLAI
jgi:hypothetical protein